MNARDLLERMALPAVLLLCAGCQTLDTLDVPRCDTPFVIDGNLDETCYTDTAPLEKFIIADRVEEKPAPTKAWAFWSPEALVVAFDCTDATPISRDPSANENDVDPQDRGELFLWSGDAQDTYYCFEIAPRGAVHDYAARFYRKFDNTWTPSDWAFATRETPEGYRVEFRIGRAAMEQCGFRLEPRARLRAGLFRADFHSAEPEATPDWISWVDAHTPQPDFHVAEAFGVFVLKP